MSRAARLGLIGMFAAGVVWAAPQLPRVKSGASRTVVPSAKPLVLTASVGGPVVSVSMGPPDAPVGTNGAFLKVEGMAGTCTIQSLEGAIPLVSWAWDMTGPPGRPVGPSGTVKPLVITKLEDGASLPLFLAYMEYREVGKARLDIYHGRSLLSLVLDEVRVTGLRWTCDATGAAQEEVTLAFTRVELRRGDGSAAPPQSAEFHNAQ